jgi:hypothetical protein
LAEIFARISRAHALTGADAATDTRTATRDVVAGSPPRLPARGAPPGMLRTPTRARRPVATAPASRLSLRARCHSPSGRRLQIAR